jgi:hypothetical protein
MLGVGLFALLVGEGVAPSAGWSSLSPSAANGATASPTEATGAAASSDWADVESSLSITFLTAVLQYGAG